MKIAIFWFDLLHYHVARLRALFELAIEQEHSVSAFILSSEVRGFKQEGYQGMLAGKINVLSAASEEAGPYSQTSKRSLIKALSEHDPDVVAIIGYDGKVSRAALGWCRRHRKAAVLMLESQERDMPRTFLKEAVKASLLQCFDAVLAGGSTQRDYAVKLGVPHDRIFTGYDVVDNAFWYEWAERVRQEPTAWHQRLCLPERYFMASGRFVSKKNFAGLIRAYARYVSTSNGSPWHLVIAGDGELRAELEALVFRFGLADLVLFPGYLTAEQLGPYYGLASAFILPSAYFEQWGLVVNEAMAAGLPVLVSEICGCASDLVKQGKTGFTFDPHNETELTQLLTVISSGKVDLEEMGVCSQQHILEKYSPQVFAHNLISASQVALAHAESRKWPLWPSPWLWP